MAPEGRRKHSGLTEVFLREPDRFEFFQAVRLLEHIERERMGEGPSTRLARVGQDEDPRREVLRFRAQPSLSFPGGEVVQIDTPTDSQAEMIVSFFGLTGPAGVLPRHYTEMMLVRLKEKDTTLRDFFDLFNHRLISLFFRAWEKYRLPFGFEHSRLDDPTGPSDMATRGFFSFVGLGTNGLRNRLAVSDDLFVYNAGHFAHHPRSAIALESLLGEFLEMSVAVLQLQGQWLALDRDDLAFFPGLLDPDGRNTQLGVNLVIGERVWDIQSKIRLRIAGLTHDEFRSLMPDGERLLPLCQVTRFYVGQELDFDIQPVLLPSEVPWCRLDAHDDPGPRLGWNTWLRTGLFDHPVDDAVFSLGHV